jgi:hypothetical protein
MNEEMIKHTDRRNGQTKPLITSLDNDILYQHDLEGACIYQLALQSICEVRLTVETAAKASQVVCRVTDLGGQTLSFGSMTWLGPVSYESSVETFQPLLVNLHQSLEVLGDKVAYLEGRSLAFTMTLFIFGILFSFAGTWAFVDYFLLKQEIGGLFALPAIAGGVWIVRLFKPQKPKSYNPAVYRQSASDNP